MGKIAQRATTQKECTPIMSVEKWRSSFILKKKVLLKKVLSPQPPVRVGWTKDSGRSHTYSRVRVFDRPKIGLRIYVRQTICNPSSCKEMTFFKNIAHSTSAA